jgi:hypothetical protein
MAGQIDGDFLGTLLPNGPKSMSRWYRVWWLPLLCALSAMPMDALAPVQGGPAELFRAGKQAMQALEMIDHAVTLGPECSSVHFTRGQVLAKLGQAKEARVEFDRTAELDKSFNDRLQQNRSADNSADAQLAAQE